VIKISRLPMTTLSVFAAAAAGFGWLSAASAAPMVYTGIVVTDVRVADKPKMHNATLTITVEADPANVVDAGVPSASCTGSSFFYVPNGKAQMRIEHEGKIQAAHVDDGQIVITLDACSGGIGFGAIFSSGLQVAYPLAFSQGTAQVATGVVEPRSGPSAGPGALSAVVSATGVAWSCIGYPPVQTHDLQGTPDGLCTSPDTYPITSDIGNIYIYQPYYELWGSQITSDHDGSTNRGAFLIRRKPD